MVDKIKIIGFEKDLALWAAETKGFFAAQDLTIAFTQTRNSTEEIAGLLDGTWNIAFDNGDNVVAWDEGHGADGALDTATLRTVLDLRVKTGIMPSPAPAPVKYCDASYYQAASALIATAG